MMKELLRGRRSVKKPAPSAPPLPIPKEPTRPSMVTLEGLILLDLEGPIPANMMHRLIKRLSGHLVLNCVSANSTLAAASPYLLYYFYHVLKTHLPCPSGRYGKPLMRVSCSAPIQSYTSASCSLYLPVPLELPISHVWEIAGLTSYPIIIHCSGELKISSDAITHRDDYRARGFESIPYPNPKWISRNKTLLFNYSELGDINLSLEATWPSQKKPLQELDCSLEPEASSSTSFLSRLSPWNSPNMRGNSSFSRSLM